MKKISLFALLLTFVTCFSFAQDKKSGMVEKVAALDVKQEVTISERSMSKGQHTCYTIILPSSDKKEMEKAWSKHMKEYKGKTKREKKTKEYFTDNAKIEAMSDNTVDVYCQMQELGNEIQMMVWYDLGGSFVSKTGHPEASVVAEQILTSFSRSVAVKNTEEQLKIEEKSHKKIAGELKKNEKELKNLEKDIEDYKKKIKEAEEEIVKNKAENTTIKTRLATQAEHVLTIKTKLKEM